MQIEWTTYCEIPIMPGVEYGRYDWRRIAATIEMIPDTESGSPRIAVSEDGRHAAEALIIARYMMFNQVYFHKTRVVLDHLLQLALGEMLPTGRFPSPTVEGLNDYLRWDDWRVLGLIGDGQGGDPGRRLRERDLYNEVWCSPEFPSPGDEAKLNAVIEKLGGLCAARCDAEKSWYKVGNLDLLVVENRSKRTKPLSLCSTIVGNMRPTRRTRLYVKREDRDEATRLLEG